MQGRGSVAMDGGELGRNSGAGQSCSGSSTSVRISFSR